MRSLILIFIALFASINLSADGKADYAFLNGKILTMDEPLYAQAVAIQGSKILAVGTNEQILDFISDSTKVIDLKGALLMPGFIESHAHFLSLGKSLCQVDLVGTESPDEILVKIKAAADQSQKGQWILGRGWDQNDWEKKEFPTASMLDKAAPDNPVYLSRVCGHAVWVNSAAMKLASIDKNTPNVKGGEIIKDDSGEPIGIFLDNAIGLFAKVMENPRENEVKEYFQKADKHCLKYGITTFHDMMISIPELNVLEKLYKAELLNIRIYEYLSTESGDISNALKQGPRIGLYNDHLTVRGVKAFIDGALGSRGALLFEPYSDKPSTSGLQVTPDNLFKKIADNCKKYGFQLVTHAIGDKGNHIVLNHYENTIGADKEGKYRWRIEHAQILAPEDIPRFIQLGIIPSMQPTHCTSDMPWAPERLGAERIKGAYVWKTLINLGAVIPGGSDAPVEDVNPIEGIYAAVTRQDKKGNPAEGWNPKERVTRMEALKMFTVWGAYGAFEEDRKGKIKPGFLADVIVLDKDITEIQAPDILKTKVMMTMVGGKIVYQADKGKNQ
ncbi:MAG: amidohydrolase [Acidobacteria bacterium]|nr:amidohydrolase [Acidobacteriota bacterium]